jgi:predicted site-specific integrase-resolvase
MLNVSIQTIKDWITKGVFLPGEVVAPVVSRGRYRIRESAVRRLLGQPKPTEPES